MVLRVLKIRISDNIISSEYKEKMLKSKEFYNSCLYLTRFRYFEYLGHKDKLDYEVRKNYDLEDWFKNKDVFLSNSHSYGNELVEIFNLLYSLSERTGDYKEKHNLQIQNKNGDLITDYSIDNLQLKPKFKTILSSQIENKLKVISTIKDEEIKNNYIFELNIFNKLKDINKVIFLFNLELNNESRIIMLHYSGLYLFEIVNYKGWLYGNKNDYNWVCTYFNNNKEKEKVIFYNPILKNKNNIEKIQTLLGSKKYPIYNYIILNNNLTLKNKNLNNTDFKILTYSDIDKHFKETDRITKNKINKEELKEIIFKLYPLSKVKNQSV